MGWWPVTTSKVGEGREEKDDVDENLAVVFRTRLL